MSDARMRELERRARLGDGVAAASFRAERDRRLTAEPLLPAPCYGEPECDVCGGAGVATAFAFYREHQWYDGDGGDRDAELREDFERIVYKKAACFQCGGGRTPASLAYEQLRRERSTQVLRRELVTGDRVLVYAERRPLHGWSVTISREMIERSFRQPWPMEFFHQDARPLSLSIRSLTGMIPVLHPDPRSLRDLFRFPFGLSRG